MLQWTLGYMCLFQLWFSLGICPLVGLLGYMRVLFLVLKRNSILSFIVVIPIYIPIPWVVSLLSIFSESSVRHQPVLMFAHLLHNFIRLKKSFTGKLPSKDISNKLKSPVGNCSGHQLWYCTSKFEDKYLETVDGQRWH